VNGKVKEAAGQVTGNAKLQSKGKADQRKDNVPSAFSSRLLRIGVEGTSR
jgi:uncharacterized protein YjbJ (UPF0337 family)